LAATKQLIQTLNPKATILTCSYGQIDLKGILNTHRFNMKDASESPGWLLSFQQQKQNGSAVVGEADEYGVTSFVYQERTKPFHPQRLHSYLSRFFCFADQWNAVTTRKTAHPEEVSGGDDPIHRFAEEQTTHGRIWRSKGTCWIAGRDDDEMTWSQTGRIIQIASQRPWYCRQLSSYQQLAPDLDDDDDAVAEHARIRALLFRPPDDDGVKSVRYQYGDRRQEIVFIGTQLQKEAIVQGLNACLLTDEEMQQHDVMVNHLPIGYYPDPFVPRALVTCGTASNLFMICRPGQHQPVHITSGFCLTLHNIALHIVERTNDDDENDDDDAANNNNTIRVVQVWLDPSDQVTTQRGGGVLLAVLRPGSHEQQSVSIKLMPLSTTTDDHGDDDADHDGKVEGTGDDQSTHRRIRVIVIPQKRQRPNSSSSSAAAAALLDTNGASMESCCCEVHFIGTVEPLPYSEIDSTGHHNDNDDDDDEDSHGGNGCNGSDNDDE
jgi:G3E family GTPase